MPLHLWFVLLRSAFQTEKNTQTTTQPDSDIQGKLQVSLTGAAGGVFAGAAGSSEQHSPTRGLGTPPAGPADALRGDQSL